tara:strand:+ start:155 stop:481 length:327 start_codon:yes stop_codon:yes gene_type:complete
MIGKTRIFLAKKETQRRRKIWRARVNVQKFCRGLFGRVEANRRRVIREAVRFVVRTSILFGAARASAELMEVRRSEASSQLVMDVVCVCVCVFPLLTHPLLFSCFVKI